MANTYTLISSNTLTSTTASVTFSSIPATYTDLVLRISARTDRATTSTSIRFTFNGSGTGYSYTYVYGNGSSTFSSRASAQTNMYFGDTQGSTSTANTFSSHEIYIPSYTVSQNKPVGVFSVQENNNAAATTMGLAGLWSNTAAISSMTFTHAGGTGFVSGSSFYLYGIKNS